MKLLTTEDYINNDRIDKEIMNNYCLVRDNIKKFENNSNEEIFDRNRFVYHHALHWQRVCVERTDKTDHG